MKFDYETKQDDRECVAYIDRDGDLIVRDENPHDGNNCGAIYMTKRGNRGVYENEFDPSEATHKFYPGDSITLTFE
jgi:hypothetical protein